jgi:hypothetical protein
MFRKSTENKNYPILISPPVFACMHAGQRVGCGAEWVIVTSDVITTSDITSHATKTHRVARVCQTDRFRTPRPRKQRTAARTPRYCLLWLTIGSCVSLLVVVRSRSRQTAIRQPGNQIKVWSPWTLFLTFADSNGEVFFPIDLLYDYTGHVALVVAVDDVGYSVCMYSVLQFIQRATHDAKVRHVLQIEEWRPRTAVVFLLSLLRGGRGRVVSITDS